MTEYFIGTGGWAYFKVPNKPSLKAYSEIFNFVEVNYTFYKYPRIITVQKWRQTVPKNFTFAVRCHQDLTHKIGLKPVDEAYAVFSQMIGVCRMLEAPFLHLETPPKYVFDNIRIEQAEDFLSSVNMKGVRLAWEVRSPVTPELVELMQDSNIVHSVDLSREEPSAESDTVYTRLFGKGKHNIYQFTDEELSEVDSKILKLGDRMVLVTFHGLRMNTDAARFRKYHETGKFITVTAFTGIDSVKAVLQEDAKFPSTRAELVKHQGWKIIDLSEDKRIRLSELLMKMPDKTYGKIHDVTKELGALL